MMSSSFIKKSNGYKEWKSIKNALFLPSYNTLDCGARLEDFSIPLDWKRSKCAIK